MMRYVILLLVLWSAAGCTWQANSGSQAVEINPLNYGTDRPIVQPSNMPGYIDGQPVDMRRK
jgi:hypothetical protein